MGIGRCGRQGDPGTYRQFLALDDEILETAYGPKKAEKFKQRGITVFNGGTGIMTLRWSAHLIAELTVTFD